MVGRGAIVLAGLGTVVFLYGPCHQCMGISLNSCRQGKHAPAKLQQMYRYKYSNDRKRQTKYRASESQDVAINAAG